jgi:sugar/nucleoside kinase (ribokinase family)
LLKRVNRVLLIRRGDEIVRTGIVQATAIDTTGAGDAYAAGFLYGLTQGYSLSKCSHIAAMVSGKVVEVMGAKIPDALWPAVLKPSKVWIKTIHESEHLFIDN